MDILSSQAPVAGLRGLFTPHAPLTSTLRGLPTLIAAAAVYAAFHPLRGQKPNKEPGECGWDKFIVWSRKIDHPIAGNWSYVTGTHSCTAGAPAQHRLPPGRLAVGPATPGPALRYLGSMDVSPAWPGIRRINQLIRHTCLSTTQIEEADEDGERSRE